MTTDSYGTKELFLTKTRIVDMCGKFWQYVVKTIKNLPRNKISFEEFERIINKIKTLRELDESLANIAYKYSRDTKDDFEIMLPSCLEDDVITLLEYIYDDRVNGWISYWIYELEFGEKYREGTITLNGKDIRLKTARDLWEVLITEDMLRNE